MDGKPFTLDLLGELIQHPKTGPATKYVYYWNDLKAQIGGDAPKQSYWMLMTRDVLPGTRSKTYPDQCKVLEQAKKGQPYEVPGVLDAAAAILMEHASSGAYLYGKGTEPWTFTRCHEQIKGDQGAVGGFGAAGLGINGRFNFDYRSGLGCSRKFSWPLGAWILGRAVGEALALGKGEG